MPNLELLNEQLRQNTIYMQNRVKVYISVYGNQFSRETVYRWLTEFRLFKPTRMSVYQNGRRCPGRYNEDALKKAALNVESSFIKLQDTKHGLVEFSMKSTSAYFYCNIPLSFWKENKKEIIEKYQQIFMELGACFGCIVNYFDDYVIQNPISVNVHSLYKLDDNDFPGINKTPLVVDKSSALAIYKQDETYLPGRLQFYGEMMFTVSHYMWFGDDYYRFFSKDKLEAFSNCEENVSFANGYRRICLWEDIYEYNSPIYRERQWAFRKEMNMDEILDVLLHKPFIFKDENVKPNPSIEFKRGSFSHGGELLAIYYQDEKGRNCTKSAAYYCVEREMKGNSIVWQERRKL